MLANIESHPQRLFSFSEVMSPLTITERLIKEQDHSLLKRLIAGETLNKNLKKVHSELQKKYLLPRLVHALEAELCLKKTDSASLNRIFNALALYLALSGQIQLTIREQKFILGKILPISAPDIAIKKQIMSAFLNLLESGNRLITPDNALIRAARLQISKLSRTSRALYLLENEAQAVGLPGWNAADIIRQNPDGIIALYPPAGKTNLISGFYTKKGFDNIVIPHFSNILHNVIAGQKIWSDSERTDPSILAQNILTAYSQNFYQIWTDYLTNIHIQLPDQTNNANAPVPETGNTYNILLLKLLQDIAAQTALIPFPDKPDSELTQASNNSTFKDNLPFAPLQAIFKKSNTPEKAPALLDQFFATFDPIIKNTNRLNTKQPPEPDSVTETRLFEQYKKLRDLAPSLPLPLRSWTEQFLERSEPELQSTLRQMLNRQWGNQNNSICQKLVSAHYPFKKNTSYEITMEDFARLFGPDGIFTNFTNTTLKPYIDTSAHPWRWQKQDLTEDPSGFIGLEMFERADLIRQSFFPDNAQTPAISFNINAQKPPAGIEAVLLEIEDASVAGSSRQNDTVSIQWPSSGTNRTSKLLVFTSGWQELINTRGSWSLFRLLDRAIVKQTANGQFLATFNIEQKPIRFQLNFSALFPAYNKELLQNFRCPKLK